MTGLSCDVVVIGGGATGVCAAYDLARRGLSVILADMNDLTTGTSGRYHGLLHSGGRYAVKDPESARECIEENLILRRIAPHIVEDTGGLFVAAADDPPGYAPKFVAGCEAAGIPVEEVSLAQARREEPALRADLARAYRVPDGAVDGFDLGHAFTRAAESYNAQTLIYHQVTGLQKTPGGMRVTLQDRRGSEAKTVDARWVLNAAGPWAGAVAALAGHELTVRWSRGVMIAMNIRWVNTVINRLRPPSDGDILVPVGTVSIIGTTSVKVDHPDDNVIDAWEVSKMLDEGDAIIDGFRQARALRAWSGVRPLYESPGQTGDDAQGRDVKRTFSVVRHEAGFTSVVGGKLTTARLMAEKAADDICAGLGIDAPCTTADDPLPTGHARRYHTLGHRLHELESGEMPGALICECEMISQGQLEAAIKSYTAVPALDDLRRDLRLGMGPCQGGFCAVRAAGILRRVREISAGAAAASLRAFVNERFKGGRSLLWGHHLRQFLLDEMIYRRALGLDLLEGQTRRGDHPLPGWAQDARAGLPDGTGRSVIVIGAGLAGLAAAVHAVQAGAKVRVLASGIGRLILTPGWLRGGKFAGHPGIAAFEAWCAAQGVVPLGAESSDWPTALGALQPLDSQRENGPNWQDGQTSLVVGFAGWRDFDPHLCAGNLSAQGAAARAVTVDLPRMPRAHWDLSPTELAHYFDDAAFREEVARLVKGRLRDEVRVFFPAVLGLHDHPAALNAVEAAVGLPVHEVPTIPPSVPGTRLFNALKRWLITQGARVQIGHAVTRPVIEGNRVVGAAAASVGRETVFRADAFILATGGLYGGGILSDDRGRVWEPVFGLPVSASDDRTGWFREDLLDPSGHPVHEFGLMVDDSLRPLNENGSPAYANLFAAGQAIGGMDRVTADCEEGFDLASGFAAVCAALQGTTAKESNS